MSFNNHKLLRKEKWSQSHNKNDKFFKCLVDKDFVKFWQTWKSLTQSKNPLPAKVDGHFNDADITNNFSEVLITAWS